MLGRLFVQAMVDIFTLLLFITSCKIGEQVPGRVLFFIPLYIRCRYKYAVCRRNEQ